MRQPSKTHVATFGAGLLLVASLPFVGRSLRLGAAPGCAFDGVQIDQRHVVRVVDGSPPAERRFCSIGCAESWLEREPRATRRVFVVDEQGGGEIDADDAWFVRSGVIAVEATADRTHAFASFEAAQRHAEEFRGTLLTGDDRPFRHVH